MAVVQLKDKFVGGLESRLAVFGEGTLVTTPKVISDANGQELLSLGIYGINAPIEVGQAIPEHLDKQIDELEFAPMMLVFKNSKDVIGLIDTLMLMYTDMVRHEAVEDAFAQVNSLGLNEESEDEESCGDADCELCGAEDLFTSGNDDCYDDESYEYDEELESGYNFYCTGEQDCLDTAMEMANAKALELVVQALNNNGVEVTYEEIADMSNTQLGFFLFMLDATVEKEGEYAVTKLEGEPILYASATPEINGNSVGFEYKLV